MTLAKITRKDEALIAALLSNPTVRAAAQAVGRSETQVYSRLRDPTFKARYDEARRELLERSVTELQAHLSEAVGVFVSVMRDRQAPQQTRLNAAEAVMRNCLKLTEQVDVIERLERLEGKA